MATNKNQKTTTLQIFNNATEANLAKSILQKNGIESFIENENVVGLNPLGGIELNVFTKDLEASKKILSK